MQNIYNTYNETVNIYTGILSLNNLSGIVHVSGLGNISIFTGENTIFISGNNLNYNLENYVLSNQTGDFSNIYQLQNLNNLLFNLSGDLINVYYPLNNNPSGYITLTSLQNYVNINSTGNFTTVDKINNTGIFLNTKINNLSGYTVSNYVQKNQTGNFVTTNTLPSITINTLSGIYYLQKQLMSGASDFFITFPQFMGFKPLIMTTIYQSGNNINVPFVFSTISGITSGGFWLRCSDIISDNRHFVNCAIIKCD